MDPSGTEPWMNKETYREMRENDPNMRVIDLTNHPVNKISRVRLTLAIWTTSRALILSRRLLNRELKVANQILTEALENPTLPKLDAALKRQARAREIGTLTMNLTRLRTLYKAERSRRRMMRRSPKTWTPNKPPSES